jgi:HK97 family phage major capsid protein
METANPKPTKAEGFISGYASVYCSIDSEGDVIKPNAFALSVRETIPLLWQHHQDEPIGVITLLQEDMFGLYMEAQLNLSTSRGLEAYNLIKDSGLSGLSIGFITSDFEVNQKTNVRVISSAKLLEISVVSIPAHSEARITEVKSAANSSQVIYKTTKLNKQNEDFMTTELETRLNQLEAAMSRPASVEAKNGDFANYIKKGISDNLETKALSNGVNGDGGFLITPQLHHDIVEKVYEASPIRNLANVVNITTASLDVVIEDTRAGALWNGENTSVGDTASPTFTRKNIVVHDLIAQPKATIRFLEDNSVDAETWLAGRLADNFTASENAAFINGDGVNKPKGILSYVGTSLTPLNSGVAGGLSGDSIVNLVYSLPEQYHGNAAFVMSRATAQVIRQLKDSTGHYIWASNFAAGQPETLLGHPVHLSSDMPNPANNSISVLFGDLSKAYTIVDRQDITILRDQYTDKPFVKFYATKRVGGDVVNFDAIKVLKLAV